MGLELFFGLLTVGLLASVIVKLNRLQTELEQLCARLADGTAAGSACAPD
jgi:hypothetical protein